MKSVSIALYNDRYDIRHSVSAVCVQLANTRLPTKGAAKSVSIMFAGGSNLAVLVTDIARTYVAGAEVSLIERGLVLVGDWQPSDGMLAGAIVGNCYRVTAGGDYGGETWEAGDLAVVITGVVLERRVNRFVVTDAGGYARLMASYNVDLILSVTHASWQAERHVLRYLAGANSHNVTMYPLISIAHTPRGHCVSAAPGDRANTIYL